MQEGSQRDLGMNEDPLSYESPNRHVRDTEQPSLHIHAFSNPGTHKTPGSYQKNESQPYNLESGQMSPGTKRDTREYVLGFLALPNVRELLTNPSILQCIEKYNSDEKKSVMSKSRDTKIRAAPMNMREESDMPLKYDFEQESVNHNSGVKQPSRIPFERNNKRRGSGTKLEDGNFLPGLIGMVAEKQTSKSKILSIVSEYLPIAIFIAKIQAMPKELNNLSTFLQRRYDFVNFDQKWMMTDEQFLPYLLRQILIYEETKIFKELLLALNSFESILTEKYLGLFESEYRFELLLELFKILETKLSRKKTTSMSPKKAFTLRSDVEDLDTRLTQVDLSRPQLILLVKKYVLCTNSNETLLAIFRHLSMSDKEVVEIFLEADEDERLIVLSKKNEDLVEYIDQDQLISQGRFKPLVLFDPSELITIFNKPYDEKNTVYEQICKNIACGHDVEALCAVVLEVHDTFWDMSKLPKFYKAMMQVFSDIKSSGGGGEHRSHKDEKDEKKHESWLIHIENPLLFCIKVLAFLKKMKKQLDFKEMEITNLMQALQAFCVSFCKNADEDVLMINLFEKDENMKDFLEYAFELQDMSILEIEFVESIIYRMWDLGRHTMQTISQFMRLNFFSSEITKFTMDVFKRKFEMPIEEGDSFQMEFRYTSNSVFMKVISELMWPLLLIVFEFIFSLQIIGYYRAFEFTENWMVYHYKLHPISSVIHMYLRGSLIVSNLLKSFLLKKYRRDGFYHYYFYNILHALFFIQLIIYPFFYIEDFMMASITQMLIVLTLIAYVWYNSIALNDVGITLRIFANMVFVVIIFGVVSILVMLMISFAIHSIFIDFEPRDSNGNQLNMFRSLYNGVLTLYEFVFGAVVFIRPYKEQDAYSVSMTFFMVIFSFFGNIMVANMLIAFLSRQFDEITRLAKYYTMRMQFGLVKIFNMEDLDTMFSMPFPLVGLALPFYLFMTKGGASRKKINRFLRKVIHVTNVFIPTFIVMNIYLIILMPIRYVEILVSILIKVPISLRHSYYLFVWMIAGPFLIFKLYFLDVATMCRIMLDFSYQEEDLLSTKLEVAAEENTIKTFKNIIRIAAHYLEIMERRKVARSHPTNEGKEAEHFVRVQDFLDIMGLNKLEKKLFKKMANHLAKSANDSKNSNESSSSSSDDDDDDSEKNNDPDDFGLSFSSKFSAIYSQPQEKLVRILLKKFTIQRNNEEFEKLKIDLDFMMKKLKKNVNLENIHRLIGFDISTLHKASKLIRKNQEADFMTELNVVRERVTHVDSKIDEVVHELGQVKSLQSLFLARFSELKSKNKI